MLKLATVFSGIGAIEHALKRMGIDHKIVFACDNGDVDIFSKKVKDTEIKEVEDELVIIKDKIHNLSKNNLVQYPTQIDDINQLYSQIEEQVNTAKKECTLLDKKNKEYKKILENFSTLVERVNVLGVFQELSKLTTYDEKKQYIDSLYKNREKQNKVRSSYFANYDIEQKDFHWNVSFLDGNQYKNEVDLFVGGSPCQSFSLVGKQKGLEDTRGTLFYEYARLVEEIKPKVFIYENVKAVLSNDNGKTWAVMQNVFDELGYDWEHKILNSRDFGIPQNRERLFVVGFRKDLKLKQPFSFPTPITLERKMQDFLVENASGKYYLATKGVDFVTSEKNLSKRYTQIDGDVQLCQKKNQQFNWHGDFIFVEENNDLVKTMQELEKYFLSKKVEKYVLATGTKGFYSKPKTDLEIARPLLTTMHKMHRAGVDNYVTTEGRLRKLTPRECLRLMGFCDSFKIKVSDTAMYQQAGNSIVVNVLIAIMDNILKSYNIVEE